MRVLALVTDAFGGFGGISEYNRQFLTALSEYGATAVVLPRLGGVETSPRGIRQLPPNSGRAAYSLALARLLSRDRDFDLVWCGHIRLAPLAALVARLLKAPMWLQIHGVDAWTPLGRIIERSLSRADLITAVSSYTRNRFLEWAPVDPERVRVLPNCVDPRFSPGEKRTDLVACHRLVGKRILFTVSRLSHSEQDKGHDKVISLLPKLRMKHPNVVYLIGGDGDGRNRLEMMARDLGVDGLCRFVGRIPDADIVDYFRLADVFVMPSQKEGFGIVYLEAMACGVPAVGLNVDGSVDPLNACSLGYAVAESELGGTLSSLLECPKRVQADLPAGLEPFTRRAFAQNVCKITEELCR